MKRFAVKIGEIHLRSSKPITDEQRKQVLRHFEKHQTAPERLYYFDDLEVVLTVNSH